MSKTINQTVTATYSDNFKRNPYQPGDYSVNKWATYFKSHVLKLYCGEVSVASVYQQHTFPKLAQQNNISERLEYVDTEGFRHYRLTMPVAHKNNEGKFSVFLGSVVKTFEAQQLAYLYLVQQLKMPYDAAANLLRAASENPNKLTKTIPEMFAVCECGEYSAKVCSKCSQSSIARELKGLGY